MYIIVVGGGKVGYPLAKALVNGGHEVTVIERDAKKVQAILDDLGNVALRGDGSDPSLLEEAGAERADVLIATAGNDEDNLAACQLAQHKFNVGRTIALINNPQNEALFRLLDAGVTVSVTQMILADIEEELPARQMVRVLPVVGNREVLNVDIPPEAGTIGQPLREVELPPDTFITAIISREGHLKAVDGDTVLDPHDAVVALTTVDSAEALLETLTREA